MGKQRRKTEQTRHPPVFEEKREPAKCLTIIPMMISIFFGIFSSYLFRKWAKENGIPADTFYIMNYTKKLAESILYDENQVSNMTDTLIHYLNITNKNEYAKECIRNNSLFKSIIKYANAYNSNCTTAKGLLSLASKITKYDPISECFNESVLSIFKQCDSIEIFQFLKYYAQTDCLNSQIGDLYASFSQNIQLSNPAKILVKYLKKHKSIPESSFDGVCQFIDSYIEILEDWNEKDYSYFCKIYSYIKCPSFEKHDVESILSSDFCE